MNKPIITKFYPLSIQVCVPASYTDEEVISFSNSEAVCGTERGWQIRKAGNDLLAGDPERNPCIGDKNRVNFVHIMLDA